MLPSSEIIYKRSTFNKIYIATAYIFQCYHRKPFSPYRCESRPGSAPLILLNFIPLYCFDFKKRNVLKTIVVTCPLCYHVHDVFFSL